MPNNHSLSPDEHLFLWAHSRRLEASPQVFFLPPYASQQHFPDVEQPHLRAVHHSEPSPKSHLSLLLSNVLTNTLCLPLWIPYHERQRCLCHNPKRWLRHLLLQKSVLPFPSWLQTLLEGFLPTPLRAAHLFLLRACLLEQKRLLSHRGLTRASMPLVHINHQFHFAIQTRNLWFENATMMFSHEVHLQKPIEVLFRRLVFDRRLAEFPSGHLMICHQEIFLKAL